MKALLTSILLAGFALGACAQSITFPYPATFQSQVFLGAASSNGSLHILDTVNTNWLTISTTDAELLFEGQSLIGSDGNIYSDRITNALRTVVFAQSMSTNISPTTITPRFLGDELICTESNGFWKTITGATTNDWKFFVYQ